VKVHGVALWPAKIAQQTEGGETVQRAGKSGGKVLVKSFGDDAYMWAKPQAVRPFEGAESALDKAPARVKGAIQAAIGHGKPPRSPSKVAERTESGLSAYEMQRLDTMRENQRILEALGVVSASESLRRLAPTPEKQSMDPAMRAAKAQERQERMEDAKANRRQSSRLKDLPEGHARPKRFADELNDFDDGERELAHLRKRARRGQRGSGTHGGGKLSSLSTKEREAIAAAYDEARDWLEHMRRYFTDKLSEANLRSVMRKVEALATGEGVAHTNERDYFRKGQPITLDEDMVALRAEANRFLPPEQDPGHGWRLDHPIGKLAIFQAHLHAQQVA